VDALERNGFKAALFNSTLDDAERTHRHLIELDLSVTRTDVAERV